MAEFKEIKDVLFYRKINRHKRRRIQSKKLKLGTYEIDKTSLSSFDDKSFVLDDEIFHKHSVTRCEEIQKGYDKKGEIKKDCDDGKRL